MIEGDEWRRRGIELVFFHGQRGVAGKTRRLYPLNLLPELLLLEVQCSIFAEADDDQRCACQLWDESLRKRDQLGPDEAHCRVDCRRNDTSTIHDLIPVSAFFVMMKGAFATPKRAAMHRDEPHYRLQPQPYCPAAYFAPVLDLALATAAVS